MEKNVHTFIGCDCEYDDAKIVLFGAPYDSTTSFRPGTRFASSAMRNESFGIETYSPYQDKDLLDVNVFDSGDLELPFGNPEGALRDIHDRTAERDTGEPAGIQGKTRKKEPPRIQKQSSGGGRK